VHLAPEAYQELAEALLDDDMADGSDPSLWGYYHVQLTEKEARASGYDSAGIQTPSREGRAEKTNQQDCWSAELRPSPVTAAPGELLTSGGRVHWHGGEGRGVWDGHWHGSRSQRGKMVTGGTQQRHSGACPDPENIFLPPCEGIFCTPWTGGTLIASTDAVSAETADSAREVGPLTSSPLSQHHSSGDACGGVFWGASISPYTATATQ
jgi:hypothetical protein